AERVAAVVGDPNRAAVEAVGIPVTEITREGDVDGLRVCRVHRDALDVTVGQALDLRLVPALAAADRGGAAGLHIGREAGVEVGEVTAPLADRVAEPAIRHVHLRAEHRYGGCDVVD